MARWKALTNGLEVLLCLSVRESSNGIELYEGVGDPPDRPLQEVEPCPAPIVCFIEHTNSQCSLASHPFGLHFGMPATIEKPIHDDGLSQSGQTNGNRLEPISPSSRILFGAAIFLSAFLLFFVQLLLAKRILPIFGGAPSVWTSCIMFFQILLLAGYVLAHFLASRFELKNQGLAVVALLAISIGTIVVTAFSWPTPITPSVASGSAFFGHPSLAIVKFLSLAIGLPFLI